MAATELQGKKATHDLKQKYEEDEAASGFPELPKVPSYFKTDLGSRRISARPITIITTSDQDIMNFKEHNFGTRQLQRDQLLPIPILPADEMDTLSAEIRVWNKNVKCVRIMFLVAFLCVLILLLGAFGFSIYWLNHQKAFKGLAYRKGTTFYNIHMCLNISSIFLMLLGVMVFRSFPHTEMRKLIWIHAVLFSVAVGLIAASLTVAFKYHKQFTTFSTQCYSLHSWVALMAVAVLVMCTISGWLFMYYPDGGRRTRHAMYGKIAFGLVGVGALLGYYERAIQFKNLHLEDDHYLSLATVWINLVGALLLAMSMCVRVALANYAFRRQPKPQWDVVVFRSIQEVEEIFIEVHEMYESFEIWVKTVNQTKMGVMQVIQSQNNQDFDDGISISGSMTGSNTNI